MNLLFLVLLTFSSVAFGQYVITCPDFMQKKSDPLTSFQPFGMTCSLQSLELNRSGLRPDVYERQRGPGSLEIKEEFNLQSFNETSTEEFCNCVTNKFNDARVPVEAKFSYGQKDLNKAIAGVFQKSLKNLFLNVTKFKNMNLSKELHNKSKSMCSPESIVASVKESCPGPAFDEKAKNVFGDGGIDAYPGAIARDFLTVKEGSNSCITKQEFLRLRSANKTSNKAMAVAKDAISIHDVFHKSYTNFDDVQFQKLLSYDPLFSLGYQYNDFNIALRKILKSKYDNKDKIANVYETIYDDEEVQVSAFDSIEKNCGEMKKHLKNFLCGDPYAKTDVKNTSLLVDSSLDVSKLGTDPLVLQATKDFFTGSLACTTSAPEYPITTDYNNFIESNILANRIIPDMISDGEGSEYSKFNKTFCQGRKEFSMQSNDLAGMMKDFFDSKKPGIDLRSFFAKDDIRALLNLNINPDAKPNFTRVVAENGVTKLPEIGSEEMSVSISEVKKKLIEAGLTDQEAQQLFGIIEMQTNARNAEIRYITQQYRQMHPEMKEISPVQVDAMLSGYSVDNFRLPKTYENTVENLSQVQQLYIDEMTRRQERFNISNSAPTGAGAVPQSVAQEATNKDNPAQTKVPETSAPAEKSAETPKEPAVAAKTTNSGTGLTVASTNSGSSGSSGSSSSYVPSSSSSSTSSSGSTGSSSGGSSYSASPSSSSDDYSHSPSTSRSSSKASSEISDDIKRIQADIDRSRRQFEETSRRLFGNTNGKTLPEITRPGRNQQVINFQKIFP